MQLRGVYFPEHQNGCLHFDAFFVYALCYHIKMSKKDTEI